MQVLSEGAEVGADARILAAALERSPGYFAVDPATADRLIAERLRMLNLYTTPFNPPDLRESYDQAGKATSSCHEVAKLFQSIAARATSLPEYSAAQMYQIAYLNLVSERRSNGSESQPANDHILDIQRNVIVAISRALENPTDLSVSDVLEAHFSGWPDHDLQLAKFEAKLLIAKHNSIRVLNNVFVAVTVLGLLWRGIFYRTIIEDFGSSPERQAAREKFLERLQDLPIEAMSHLPGIGPFVGLIKLMLNLSDPLVLKAAALENKQQTLAESYAAAVDFFETYVHVMVTWNELAWKMLGPMRNILEMHVKAFSGPTPFPWTVEVLGSGYTV